MLEILLALALFAAIADAVTTLIGIEGGAKEVNPLADSVFKSMGFKAGLAVLFAAKVLAAIFGYLYLHPVFLVLLVVLQGAVVVSNLVVLSKLKDN